MQTLDRRVAGDQDLPRLHAEPAPDPGPRSGSFPRPEHPSEVDVREAARLPLGLLALLAVAGVAVVQAPPDPLWGWFLLAAVYFLIETALAGRGRPFGEAGWPALVAMVPVIAPDGVVLGATIATVVAGLVHRARFGDPFSVSGRFLCHVPAVTAAAGVAALVPLNGVAVALVAGAVAGCIVHVQRWALPRTTGQPGSVLARHLPMWWEPLEMVGLGATAAMLGGLYASGGWIGVPLAVAALLLVAAVDQLRRSETVARRASVDAFLLALEAKDLYTRGHCERVAHLSVATGAAMGLDRAALDRLQTAAMLHDLGKVTVERHLLRKRGRLSPDEYRRVQRHTTIVGDILDGVDFLAPVATVIGEHHRHFDGSGYGAGDPADGATPSLEARILAAADAYDAMTTHRPYRRALTRAYAFAELRRCSGTQFDPEVVDALIEVVERSGDGSIPGPDVGAFDSDQEARQMVEPVAGHG